MDIKGYILWGGGILIVLVLLHGLYWAWRSRRGGAEDAERHEAEPQQTNLQLGTPPILMEAEGGDEERPWLAETGNDAAVANADGAPQAGQFNAPQRDGGTLDDRNRRVVIPGKRTEPTVPIASRSDEDIAEQAGNRHASETEDGLKDVVVIWVQAKPGASLGGRGLIEAFTANNLEYGGNVFRKLDPNTGAERYQVVNGVEPGTFDLSNVDALATSRIVMLLRFNPYNDPAEAFEDMLAVAQDVASSLNGELKDEHMSDMSIQTIEHCRQRIREYKRMSIRT